MDPLPDLEESFAEALQVTCGITVKPKALSNKIAQRKPLLRWAKCECMVMDKAHNADKHEKMQQRAKTEQCSRQVV